MARGERIHEALSGWVIYEPRSKQFIGLHWRLPFFAMMYCLGPFSCARRCASEQEANELLNKIRQEKPRVLLRHRDLARLQVRRIVRQSIVLE